MQVPRGSVIRLDGRATIRSVVLPVGSTIELGKSLTLQFSNTTSCKSETFAQPLDFIQLSLSSYS